MLKSPFYSWVTLGELLKIPEHWSHLPNGRLLHGELEADLPMLLGPQA